ncbi:MAG: flavin reductase [Thermomicrobium sp.]|jgi:flavin reductase (DIM6/NTAB) family NADH-FMN oxidoreductase RutF|uniref:flavin reductase family protein n=1 Tax=Thermomicrobium sp. TaxID=1969469 RepID=UPI001B0D637E|nr:flavin reductase family protein [Thermomicrobium sp.]MBO9359871.1 flavin reductase [Thermomicrobium sp.]
MHANQPQPSDQLIDEPAPMIDPRHFRRTMGRFATGVTVITVARPEGAHGMTANAFLSVSLDPPLVLVSVDRRARMHAYLLETTRYGVSVLARDQERAARHFAGKPQAGYEPVFAWREGVPLLEGAVAQVVCDVWERVPAGDHTLVLGRVRWLDYWEREPLVFFGGDFRCLEVQLHDTSMWWW